MTYPRRKGLPLLLSVLAVVTSSLPAFTALSLPPSPPPPPHAAAVAPPPPRPRALPPSSFVPAPLRTAHRAEGVVRAPSPLGPAAPLDAAAPRPQPFHPRVLPAAVGGPLRPPTPAEIAAAAQAGPSVRRLAVHADTANPAVGLPPAVAAANVPVQMSVEHPITEPQFSVQRASVYPEPGSNVSFSATPMSTSLLTAGPFPSFTFNHVNSLDGSGPIPRCQSYVTADGRSASEVGSSSRPLADATSRDDGSCLVQPLQSADGRYGAGADMRPAGGPDLREFQAVFTATISVVRAGPATISALVDDSAVLSVGPRANDPRHTQPRSSSMPTPLYPLTQTVPMTGPFTGYPTMAGFYQNGNNVLTATVTFPAPGRYPVEVDYVEVNPMSQLNLVLTVDEGTASRLAGELDCGACDATLLASDFPTAVTGDIPVGNPINTRTGNLFETMTDLSDAAPGRPLLWARTYNRQSVGDATNPSGLGPGWQTPYATRIISSSSIITVVTPEGNLFPFVDNGDGSFRPFPGDHASLMRNADGTYTEHTWAQETITFTASGQPTMIADAHNRALLLSYDPQNPSQLVGVTDATYPARALTIAYNGLGQTVAVTNAAGQSIGYTYDPSTGDLTGVINRAGKPTAPQTYTYLGQTHLLTSAVNALGQALEGTTYDTTVTPPRVSGQTAQNGMQMSVAYAPAATTITMTAPGGGANPTPDGHPMVETVSYDPQTDAMTGVSLDGVTQQSAQFDANFDPAATTDGMGAAHAVVTTYNRLGLPLSVVDPLGATTAITYDAQNNPITMTDPLGHQTIDGYDANNNLTLQTSGGVTTTTRYTAGGQPTDTTTPDGVVTHNDYDPATGALITATVGANLSPDKQRITVYGYDAAGRPNSVTSGVGTATPRTDLTRYNDDNTVAQTIQNAMGAGTFDPAHPDRNVLTRYGYDAAGRQIWVQSPPGTDGLARYSIIHYNAAGQTDWPLRDAVDTTPGLPALPSTLGDPAARPPSYSPSRPDANVATLDGYDALGRQVLVTQTGVLAGTFDTTTGTFSAAATRVTRTEYDLMGRPMTTTQNLVGSGVFDPAHPDQNVRTVQGYDAAGNVQWQGDALGRWTYTQYDNNNRPVTTTVNDVAGHPPLNGPPPVSDGADADVVGVTEYNLDGTTRDHIDAYAPGTTFDPTAPITDRLTLYGYDGWGRPVTTTVNAYTATVNGVPTLVDAADPAGRPDLNRTTVISYDVTSGGVVGQRDALGRWTSTRYDAANRPAAAIRDCYTVLPDGTRLRAAGNCASYDPAHPDQNLTTTTGYDAQGRAATATDALNTQTTTGYDGLGRTVAMTTGDTGGTYNPASPDQNVATGTAYNALGQTVAATDGLGTPTTYAYNGLGQTVAVTTMTTLSTTSVTRSGYDGTGALRWTLSPVGLYTVYGTDGLGRVLTTTQNYTFTGQPLPGRTDANLSTGTVYDAAGRVLETIDPAGHVVSTTYNLRDQPLLRVQNVQATCPASVSDCNVTASSQYDRAGALVASIDANGNVTRDRYDAAGEQTGTTGALGATTAISYDAGGRVITTTDVLGRSSVSAYDGLDEVISTTTGITNGSPGVAPSVGATAVYTYGAGVLTAQQDPNGIVTQEQRDALGRTITTTVGSGATQQRTVYGYDADGRTLTTTVGAGTALAQASATLYNPDGSTAASVQNAGGAGVFSPGVPDRNVPTRSYYDAAGRPILAVDALGHANATHYDGAGRPDWTVRNLVPLVYDARGLPALPATPPPYTATAPSQNVAVFNAYDALGNQTLVTQTGVLTGTFDPGARTFSAVTTRATRTEYDGLSRALTTTLDYRPDLSPTGLPDANVRSLTQYDAGGNVVGRRDPLNRWSVTGYDALNRPVTTTTNYEDGNPLAVTVGAAWTNGNDTDILNVTRYNADGSAKGTIANYVTGTFNPTAPLTDRVTLYGYDGQGRVVTTTLNSAPGVTRPDLNRTTATAYNGQGLSVGQQDALGRWSVTGYDGLARAASTTRNCTDGQGAPVVSPLVQSCAPFSAATPDRNVVATTRYDALGRAFGTLDPLGHVTTTAYDGLGRTVAITQNDTGAAYNAASPDRNVATGTAYDALGRAVATTDAVGAATTLGSNDLGQTVAVTTPATTGGTGAASRTTASGYDGTGALRWSATADGRVTVYGVDGLGRTISTTRNISLSAPTGATDANLTSGVVYDAAGRTTATSDPAGRVVANTYDLRDNLIMQVRNAQASCAPGATDCNVTWRYGYDRAGARTSITDPRSLVDPTTAYVQTFGYDAADEQITATDALGHNTVQAYDAGGRLVGRQDPRGSADNLTYRYDGLDRITATVAQSLSIGQSYDALGHRVGLTDATGATSFAYDALGRTTAVTAPTTGAVGYSYDGTGRRTGLTYPDGSAVGYSYNADGSLGTVSQNGTALAGYTYDAAGRPAMLTRGPGRSGGPTSLTSYGYDGADRLIDARTTAGGLPQSRYTSVVNRLGQVTALTESVQLTPLGATSPLAGGSSSPPHAFTRALQGPRGATNGGALPATPAGGAAPFLPSWPGEQPLLPVPPVSAPPAMLVAPPAPAPAPSAHTRRTPASGITARRAVKPLRFEANRGQTNPRVQYLVRGPGYTLFLTHAAAVLSLVQTQRWTTASRPGAGVPRGRGAVLRLGLRGANLHARIVGQARQAGTTTYLRGHGAAVAVPTYARVRYENVYRGIDLVYHGREGALEYDWLLRPGASVRAIRLTVGGALGLHVGARGALLIRTPLGTLRQEPPVAYQRVRGRPLPVAVRYVHLGRGLVGLRLGRYDHHRALTIDPVLQYSSYLGGAAADAVTAVALDGTGNTYLTGYTASPDFPQTASTGLTTTVAGTSYDAFVTKLGPTGSISYSDYLGGKGSDVGGGIAVDGGGAAYVTGQTSSPDFPTTSGALTTTTPATTTNAFALKLSADGSRLVYSTELGSTAGVLTQGGLPVNGVGDSGGRAIAVDGGGNAYLTGQTDSASFPVTLLDPRAITATVAAGAVPLHGTCTLTSTGGQTGGPCYDAFVTKLGPTGSISYSTYLGGGRDDYGYGLALDGQNTGLVYVTGRTESSDFPISGTLQSFNGGNKSAACHETDCPDAFVAKLDTTMTFTTVGTLGALGTLVGGSVSNLQHPSLLWSTYLGGSGADEGTGIALDPGGNVYVTGDTAPLSTTASDFPTTTGAYSTTAAGGTCAVGPCADVFVAKLRGDGSRLTYASRFGGSGDDKGAGIAVDTAGHAYLTGSTTSADFPTLGSLQSFNAVATGAGAAMAFVTKLNVGGSAPWYSTLLGGSGGDAGAALAVDGVGDVSVAGQTGSTDVLSARPAARQEIPARQSQMGGAGTPGQPDGFTASLDATTRYLTYSYDGVQRLTGVNETLGAAYGYAYDLAGNRTDAYLNGVDTQRTAYNGASEAVSVTTPGGVLKPSYDAAGNLTGDGSAGYSYDALNRLTTLTPGTGSPTPSASYGYNGDGVLVGQTVGTTGTTYTQDLAVPAAQAQVLGTTVGATQNGGTATATDYLYATDGAAATSRLASMTGGGASHTWYVSDLQGSVRYTEGDNGAPVGGSLSYAPGPQQYDPYGAVARGADGAGPTPPTFGYRGEVQDATTGLVTLRARMYSPATGSFLTRDPLLQQTNQPYSYAGSDPVNNADPTGQRWVSTIIGGG